MKTPKRTLLEDKPRLQAAEQTVTSATFRDVVHTAFANLFMNMAAPKDATDAIAQSYMRAGAKRLMDEFDNIVTEKEPTKPLSTALEPEPRTR
jgi:hypothetical protein